MFVFVCLFVLLCSILACRPSTTNSDSMMIKTTEKTQLITDGGDNGGNIRMAKERTL